MKDKIAFLAIALLAVITVGLATPINPGHRADTVGGTTADDRTFPNETYYFPGGIDADMLSIGNVKINNTLSTRTKIGTGLDEGRYFLVLDGNKDCESFCDDYAGYNCVNATSIVGGNDIDCNETDSYGVACTCIS